MKEHKAVALNHWLTARETSSGKILLFVPSDGTEAGHIIHSQEIYLKREEIERLYTEFVAREGENDE